MTNDTDNHMWSAAYTVMLDQMASSVHSLLYQAAMVLSTATDAQTQPRSMIVRPVCIEMYVFGVRLPHPDTERSACERTRLLACILNLNASLCSYFVDVMHNQLIIHSRSAKKSKKVHADKYTTKDAQTIIRRRLFDRIAEKELQMGMKPQTAEIYSTNMFAQLESLK